MKPITIQLNCCPRHYAYNQIKKKILSMYSQSTSEAVNISLDILLLLSTSKQDIFYGVKYLMTIHN